MPVKNTLQNEIVDVSPQLLASWLKSREAVIVDVREDFEHAAEWIKGAESVPLSRLEAGALRERFDGARIVFHCQTGGRSAEAARHFMSDEGPAFHLAGGIVAWKEAGLPTERSATGPTMDVMRQTQMTIGSIVLLGVLLGVLISPWFLMISGFMGAGLVFAGATGTCGLAMLLAKMPWNRVAPCCGVSRKN